MSKEPESASPQKPWYSGITGYEWMVLAIASAGWIFDVYEGQIFNITRGQMLAEILDVAAGDPSILKYGDMFLGIFLLGGTLGGLVFGSLADKWGRRPTMVVTILFYSVFSGLTYFASELWHVAALRFLVAIGIGGEWAVAASLVSEVFPKHARSHASGIFHASSVLGTWLATFAGLMVANNWRLAYLLGILPALLILWVRASVKEPEKWRKMKEETAAGKSTKRAGSFPELLSDTLWRKRAFLGMFLAAVGLATFWGVSVGGQQLAKTVLLADGVTEADAAQKAKSAYGFIQTFGGGLGLLAFGPLCARFGRRRTFIAMHLGAFVIVPITCFGPQNYNQLVCLLPVFGFLTLGMHAGYAIYFPELFPTHLRATGTSWCFNGGRLLAAPTLWMAGSLKERLSENLPLALTILGTMYLLGAGVMLALPETKGQDLPE